jgi:hypothetical protein
MEEQQPIGFGRLLVVALCAVFIAACDQHPAIVNYTQVGACELGPHQAWVFFEIGEINNTKTNTDFKFTPLGIRLEQGMDPSVPWSGYNAIMTEWFEHKKAVTGVTVRKGTAKVLHQSRRRSASVHVQNQRSANELAGNARLQPDRPTGSELHEVSSKPAAEISSGSSANSTGRENQKIVCLKRRNTRRRTIAAAIGRLRRARREARAAPAERARAHDPGKGASRLPSRGSCGRSPTTRSGARCGRRR